MPSGTTNINMDNDLILKVNSKELLGDHLLLITKATEDFHEKCLLTYRKIRGKVVQKTLVPRVLHGQGDMDAETKARATDEIVHKPIHVAMASHNQTLINSFGNVMKEVFYGAPVDKIGPSYFNAHNPLAMGSSVPSSSQQPNGGQF